MLVIYILFRTLSLFQASFEYEFAPSESFYARPFGLTINLYYQDSVSPYDVYIIIYIVHVYSSCYGMYIPVHGIYMC